MPAKAGAGIQLCLTVQMFAACAPQQQATAHEATEARTKRAVQARMATHLHELRQVC
jgi:hypothetical protein